MIKKSIIFMIRIYQKVWSSWHMPVCRFYPSCSEYAIQALEKYGIFHAIILILYRLARCHPFCPGGYDPVP
ncbi:MAG TPA: membrane protein insertion efficiency factor YidD [Syntrophaceticus sp.]|uniref:membrane protein insertion efficiency factor YidD n=1 Tax=Syntrophaceticus schinkii TaxID=499207 RepID=UPI000A05B26B|nr:membrane protein insertion efficiency factor YidD [Syntrophaceticus schinkii]MDD2359586.1 membrane protein insertion efficiency factor YidD [Syntrophaceticus schinkii]MDD4260729.1 membrane protein insertion efficiency factor YidD [Syntrophaceticus schinkii]MDD4674768.1 membrane protein insertion efficiency factor YidD [Syntrophaceticus schinkii]HHY29362.1 membrane protein insertion efficiency factor YidD [Syntrophaceticus sp.]